MGPNFGKHGVSEGDADHARRNAIRRWDIGDNRFMAVGPTSAENLIEVGYRRLPEWQRLHLPCRHSPKEVDYPMTDSLHDTIDQARQVAEKLNRVLERAERQRDRDFARRLASGDDVEIVSTIGGSDLADLRSAKLAKLRADEELISAVAQARARGASWALIGDELDMTGEGARKRFSS